MIRKEIIGVYGTGTIGSGQATLTTGNGYAVVVVGHSARGISRCKRAIEHNWDDLIAEGLASEENKAAAMNLLIFSDELEALKDCTFILEAVSEDPDVKREVYAKIASICRPDTIFASCTSSMDADQLAADIPNPDRFLIAHPFQPVHLQPLVELVGCNEPLYAAAGQGVDGLSAPADNNPQPQRSRVHSQSAGSGSV